MSPGGASTLNIDFYCCDNIYSGVGAAPDPGTVWNAVGPSGSSSLSYSNGSSANGVSVTTTFFNQFSNADASTALLKDRLIPNDKDVSQYSVTLSGLTANGVYNLYAYTGLYSQTFSAPNAGSAIATGADYDETDPTQWVSGIQYALLSGAIADANGFLVLTVQAISPNEGSSFDATTAIAGLQVSSVPLPAALPLFAGGLGVMAWLARRRKRIATALA